MEQLELPAITTFDDARSAIAAFDERFWKHAPGLPTVRHTMIHLCMTLHRDPSMSPIAISGLALEHVARLANTAPVPPFDFDGWFKSMRFVVRSEYVEHGSDFGGRLLAIHADLNSVVHDMEEQINAKSVGMRLSKVFMSLLEAAMLVRQFVHGKTPMTPRQRFGGLEARLSSLYGEYDIDVTFNDPVSAP